MPAKCSFAGGVTVWGFISYCFTMDMHNLQGSMNEQTYRDLVLRNIAVPHFDNPPAAPRPLYMYDNTRQHRAMIVTE